MRKITIFSTQTNGKKEITTDVTTWGALKGLAMDEGIDPSGMKAMIRSTKTTLEHDDAQLPAGEFVVFLSPSKVKSGN